MRKILLITESLGQGGAERQICGLARMLTEKKYPCRLITYVDNQFYEQYLKDNKVDYELVSSLKGKFLRIYNMIKYLYGYKPDVVVSFLPSVNKMLCLASIFYNCKLIVSERNNNIKISFIDRITFFLYRKATYIVPNSYSQTQFIADNFPKLKKKVDTIINFVDFEHFRPCCKNNENAILECLIAARYGKQKNVKRFLCVINRLKEERVKIHFNWYGSVSFDREYYRECLSYVKDNNLNDYITLNPETKDIIEKYQVSDIFCLPSLYEGYPNVIIEAMCCELPIVCSNIYDNPHLVKDGINGYLFNPLDEDSIYNALKQMIQISKSDRIKMGRRNRQECLLRNSIQSFYEKYNKLINS